MTKQGDSPKDYRSEAERVKKRSGAAPFDTEYNRGSRAPESVPNKFTTASGDENQGSAPNTPTGKREHFTPTPTPQQEKRSIDADLKKEIVHRLSIEPDLSTSEITVEVHKRVALLTGSVDTINTKHRAEELISRIAGLERIENQLTIRVGEAFEEFSRGVDASRLKEEFSRTTKFR